MYWQSLDIQKQFDLAILTEKRDFVGESVGQSYGCETARGDKQCDYGLLV
jgi:hypothetical protein